MVSEVTCSSADAVGVTRFGGCVRFPFHPWWDPPDAALQHMQTTP